MMLPPSCKIMTINPRTNLTIARTNLWLKTDLQYSLVLSKLSHVIIMYQHTGYSLQNDYYFVTRIKIDAVIEKHTALHSGYTK